MTIDQGVYNSEFLFSLWPSSYWSLISASAIILLRSSTSILSFQSMVYSPDGCLFPSWVYLRLAVDRSMAYRKSYLRGSSLLYDPVTFGRLKVVIMLAIILEEFIIPFSIPPLPSTLWFGWNRFKQDLYSCTPPFMAWDFMLHWPNALRRPGQGVFIHILASFGRSA